MCGILFILDKNQNNQADQSQAEAALDAMAARGPDARNLIVGENFIAGHLRLSIQDLDNAANQPMRDEASHTILVFNGEIYNSPELRDELLTQGDVFKTNCDTEVLLKSLIRYGVEDALQKIRGMYAFVWFDTKSGTLVAARDELGQKPLYWSEHAGQLVVASSIPAVVSVTHQTEPDEMSYALYFSTAGFTAEDRTFLKGVNCLPAGSIMQQNRKGPVVVHQRFEPLDLIDHCPIRMDSQERVEELGQCVQKSVQRHLIGDVPMGVLVSGGIDSTLIWSYASRLNPRITPFTKISPGIEQVPEKIVPKLLQEKAKSWVVVETKPEEYCDGMASFIAWSGQPSRWGGGPPMARVAREAKIRGVKVLLGGDGADEFLGGYFSHEKRFNNWGGDFFELGELIKSSEPNEFYSNEEVAEWYQLQREKRNAILQVLEHLPVPLERFKSASLLQDTAVFLQCCNLPHSDAWSMSESVELRNPMLDLDLLKLGLNSPVSDRCSPRKGALRNLAKQELGEWVDVPKEGTRNFSIRISNPEYWNIKKFEIQGIKHYASRLNPRELYKLINLELFHRMFVSGDGVRWDQLMTSAGQKKLLQS